jgi:hypothetical protein
MFLIALPTQQSSITLYRMTINECELFFLSWEHFSKITLANLISYLTHWRKNVILTFYVP